MSKKFHLRIVVPFFALLALACGLAGCRPTNPLNQKISASSEEDHRLWRAHAQDSLSQAQMDDYDEAIQELRLKIMAEHVASLSDAVNEALWMKINQRPVCEVIQEGFQFQLSRLNADKVELLRVHKINASLKTKPGDTESADHLKSVRQAEAEQIAALDAKIAKVREKLQKYDPKLYTATSGK